MKQHGISWRPFFVACVHAAAVHFQGNAKQCPWGTGIAQGRTSSKYQGVYQDVYKANTLILRYPNSQELYRYLPKDCPSTNALGNNSLQTLAVMRLQFMPSSLMDNFPAIIVLACFVMIASFLCPNELAIRPGSYVPAGHQKSKGRTAIHSLTSSSVILARISLYSSWDSRMLWDVVGCCGIVGRRPCFQEIILNTVLLA